MVLPFASLLTASILTALYVSSVFLSGWLQCHSFDLECLLRVEPGCRWRLVGMAVGTVLVLLLATWLVWMAPRQEPNCIGTRELMGLHGAIRWWRDSLKPALGTLLLLSGPLLAQALLIWQTGGIMENFKQLDPWELAGALLVGPVCEELVFRACLLSVLDQWGGWSPGWAVFWSALLFSLAHGYRLIFSRDNLLPILVQMAFTGLFGVYAGVLFVWHRQVLACILAHILANAIGFPDWDRVMALPPFQVMLVGATLPVGIGMWIALYL